MRKGQTQITRHQALDMICMFQDPYNAVIHITWWNKEGYIKEGGPGLPECYKEAEKELRERDPWRFKHEGVS